MSLFAFTKMDKLKALSDILHDTKAIDIDELDQRVENKGYKMSIYEKLFILKAQIGHLQTLRDYYIEKNNVSEYMSSNQKSNTKLEDINTDLEAKIEKYEKLKNKYSELFVKSIKYYY